MDFSQLPASYSLRQDARFSQSVITILGARETKSGMTVPDADAIRLHDGRQIPIAIVFLDICSFSKRQMCSAHEQSENLKALALMFAEFVRVIHVYGGVVEKNTGDGLMAYFATESTPGTGGAQRAVACVLTLFETSRRLLTPTLKRFGLAPFRFRICADYGHVTIAKLGAPRLFNAIVAIGSRANVAGKMLSRANPEEFLVSVDLISALPIDWQDRYIDWFDPRDSGFFLRESGYSYKYFPYTGRWSHG